MERLVKDNGPGQIKVLDNLSGGSLQNLQDWAGIRTINVTHDFCLVDLRDPVRTDKFLRGADVVFHLADVIPRTNHSPAHQEAVLHDGLLIDINTITSAKASGTKDFVYIGSADLFPADLHMEPSVHALRRSQTFPAEAWSPYGWSKLMGEYQSELAKTSSFRVGILRLHNVYGPHNEYSPVSGQASAPPLMSVMSWLPVHIYSPVNIHQLFSLNQCI